jgi:hypothetical protein
VLRLRVRGDDQHRYWHVAVDDGTTDRVRAWRVRTSPPVSQGGGARARVSPWLRHVAGLESVGATQSSPAVAISATAVVTTAAADLAPPPPLPEASYVGAAIGRALTEDERATPHPLAVDPSASRTYVGPDAERIIVAWIRPEMLEGFRVMPRVLAAAALDIGDEAYRAPLGGGVVARSGSNVLLVAPSLPGLDDAARDHAVDAIARVAVGITPRSDRTAT